MFNFTFHQAKAMHKPKQAEAAVKPERALQLYQTQLQTMKDGQGAKLGPIAGVLGWLRLHDFAKENLLRKIEMVAAEVQTKADTYVLIGVGGSNNAARAAIESLLPTKKVDVIYAGNQLSAYEMQKLLCQLERTSPVIHCIAKNFATLEPGSSFRVLREYLEKRYGREEAAARIIVTGTKGRALDALAQVENYCFFEFPEDVGGRFSALSEVGLVPMAIAGVDVRQMLDGALQMENQLSLADASNVALQYAKARFDLYTQGYRIDLWAAFEPRLQYFGRWWQQLFAESEGKEGKGLFSAFVGYSEDLHSVGQYVQDGTKDLLETLFFVKQEKDFNYPSSRVEDGFNYLTNQSMQNVNKAAYEATKYAHGQVAPLLIFDMDVWDAETLGALFYFFEVACYLYCQLLGVNPFDQPGVEAYKEEMFRLLGK